MDILLWVGLKCVCVVLTSNEVIVRTKAAIEY